MSDDETETEEPSSELAEYDPVEHLHDKQLHAILKMVTFPKATNSEVANAVGVTARTIRNWKNDDHFKECLARKRNDMVDQAVSSHATRTAYVYDELTKEVMDRMGKPKTDPTELEKELGPGHTNQDIQRYQERFITNMKAKDFMRLWSQIDDKVREDAEDRATVVEEEELVHRVRDRYEELKVTRKRITKFKERTGFDPAVNIHEEDADEAFARNKAKTANQSEDTEEVIDAEYVEEDEDTGSLLDTFAIEDN